jgi:hypothetical protein
MAKEYKVIVADSGEQIWIDEDGESWVKPAPSKPTQIIDSEKLITSLFGERIMEFEVVMVSQYGQQIKVRNAGDNAWTDTTSTYMLSKIQ